MRLILLLLTTTLLLFGTNLLQNEYVFEEHNITARTLFPTIKKDFILFHIPDHQTRYRVSVNDLLKGFNAHGISVDTAGHRYINFIKHSPVNLTPIRQYLSNLYSKYYPGIVIHKLAITPRIYTPSLPQGYTLHIGRNSYKYDNGTLFALTPSGTKFFFDYSLEADVPILRATANLNRDTELSPINTRRDLIPFARLKALPLLKAPNGRYRLKRPLRSGSVVLQRHVEPTPLVTRGARVTATLKDGAVLIQFQADAVQDGGFHDIISIQKPDGERIKARVVGNNKVEIE